MQMASQKVARFSYLAQVSDVQALRTAARWTAACDGDDATAGLAAAAAGAA